MISCAIFLPARAGEEKAETPEHVLKLVEEIAAGNGRIEMPNDDWWEALNRLQARVQKASSEVEVLEHLLAKKKAEALSAEADRKLFMITHTRRPK